MSIFLKPCSFLSFLCCSIFTVVMTLSFILCMLNVSISMQHYYFLSYTLLQYPGHSAHFVRDELSFSPELQFDIGCCFLCIVLPRGELGPTRHAFAGGPILYSLFWKLIKYPVPEPALPSRGSLAPMVSILELSTETKRYPALECPPCLS